MKNTWGLFLVHAIRPRSIDPRPQKQPSTRIIGSKKKEKKNSKGPWSSWTSLAHASSSWFWSSPAQCVRNCDYVARFARTCVRRSVRSGSTQETKMSLGQESSILTQKRCNFVSLYTPDRIGLLASIASNSFREIISYLVEKFGIGLRNFAKSLQREILEYFIISSRSIR